MKKIKLTGRNSRLSLLQLQLVKRKIEAVLPDTTVEIIPRSSRGDALQDVPLHTVEGSDFFTQDIFDVLSNGEADIAVHSLKDMSSEHFFGNNHFAVIDRDDVRDVAIFRDDIAQKIKHGAVITIGTCSPRREEMAIHFLQKALPQLHTSFSIATKSIRGNVDTRLRKLEAGEYDGIILATAGLNRLLRSETDAPAIRVLLQNKKLMILPLIECVPAPCQGAIVAEAVPQNTKAIEVLKKINDDVLLQTCIKEKQTATGYGIGCLQRFGVSTINYADQQQVLYAAGKDTHNNTFSSWKDLPKLPYVEKGNIFSSTEYMGSFFSYAYNDDVKNIAEPVVYVANHKAVKQEKLIVQLQAKQVWAAGTKTWFELAQKGIWVQGSADAFGLEFLQTAWNMPLLNIAKNDVTILTNNQSVTIWENKKWKAYGTYTLLDKQSPELEQQISKADIIFWTSYRQFLQYKNIVKAGVIHSCPYGETAEQFKSAGITPVILPNIKSFSQWKQTFTL